MTGPASLAWTVPEVTAWLEGLHMPAEVVAEFQKNAVAGSDLCALSDEDLRDHLRLTALQARKVRSELVKLGVAAPAPTIPAAQHAVPAAAPAATREAPASPQAEPGVPSSFAAADLARYRQLQQSIAELQGLQIGSKLAQAQQHTASVQQQLAAAQAALPATRAALAREEQRVERYAAGRGGCLCFCKGAAEKKKVEAETIAARLREQQLQQQGRVTELSAMLQEAQSQLVAWQGKGAELETAQRTQQGLVDRMFASASWPRNAELADRLRALESQAAEAGSAAATFGRGVQLLQKAARGLQEALQAMGRTQMLGAVNMGRGIAFQARTGAGARRMPGRQMGNFAEMAVFRRANDGVAQAARDTAEASALLGPGMPRVDASILSSARAGMFQNILFGGVMSDAIQLAAVRRSMASVQELLQQVQACLGWAQQNLGGHEQRDASLRAQVASTKAELETFRQQALQAALQAAPTA